MKNKLFISFLCTLPLAAALSSLTAQTIKEYTFKEFTPLNYENTFNSAGGQQILAPHGVNLTSVTPHFVYDIKDSFIKDPTPPFDLSSCTTPATAFPITTETSTGATKETKLVVRQLQKAPYHTDGYTLPIPITANVDPWNNSATSVGYVHAAMTVSNANQWRFGTVTACLVVGIDFAPRQLTFRLWAISSSVPNSAGAGEFTIEESADGITWTTLKHFVKESDLLEAGGVNSALSVLDLKSTSRYIKFYYTTRSGVNVALNALHISAIKREPPTATTITVNSRTRTSADLSLTSDKDATCHWLVRPATNPPATTEQLLSAPSFAVKAATHTLHTLTTPTAANQVIDLLLKDADDNTSTLYHTTEFSNNTLLINNLFTSSKEENNLHLAFSANDNGTLYYRLLPLNQPIPSAQEIVNQPTASLPYTKASALSTVAITLSDDSRHTVALVLKVADELSAVHSTVIKRADATDLIRSRYVDWAVGSTLTDYSEPLIKTRHDALKSNINKARQRMNELIITSDLPAWNLDGASQTPDVSACRDVVSNILLPLTVGYSLPSTDTYHNPEVAQEIIHVYNYLAKRNFLSGSSLPFAGGGVYLGLTGYFYGSLLARDILIQEGKIKEVTDMMQWATRWVADDDPEWSATSHDNYSRADGVRTIYHNRLMYLLTLADDDTTREEKLFYLQNALNFHTQLFSAWNGFLKPDYTGYHHLGIWGNAYVTEALHVASQMAAMLHNTPYAMNETSINNLANGLIAYADYSGLYDVNRGLCGRIPTQLNNIASHVPAFTYLYPLTNADTQNRLGTKFSQLFRPDYPLIQEKMVKNVSSSISFFGGIGALQRCLTLHAQLPTTPVNETLNRFFPYGALQVHRRKDWSVTVKGYSKYVWDFEINGSENWYGRNQSLGQLALYATSDELGIVTAQASGLGYNGFDWAHVPGVTSFDMTLPQMLQEAKHFEWSKFSADDYTGGVTNGTNGLHATRFMDIRQAYTYNPRVWVGARLSARKSTFFFDDLVLMLGSDINNSHPDYDAHTTLFQNTLASANTPTTVNGTSYTALNQNYTQSTDAPAYFTDAVGNGYFLRNANGLTINRSLQTSRNDRNTTDTQDNYATAFINHSRPTAASYECAILVRGANEVATLSANPDVRYSVVQQNATAHIVQHHTTKQTGYAIFDTVGTIASTLIKSVTAPSLLLTTQKESDLTEISFCNPELGYYPKDKFPFQVWSVDKDKQFATATHQPYDVTLMGEWLLTTPHPSLTLKGYDAPSNTTTINVNAIHGESYTASFKCLFATSTPNTPQSKIRLLVQSSNLYIRGVAQGITVNIFNILGQHLQSTTTSSDITVVNLSTLPRGTYLVKIGSAQAEHIQL